MPIKDSESMDGVLLGLLDCARGVLQRSRSIRDTVEELTERQRVLKGEQRLSGDRKEDPDQGLSFREACQQLTLEIQSFKSYASDQMDELAERCKKLNSQETLNEDFKVDVEEALMTLKLEGAQLETILISIEAQKPWHSSPGHPPEIDFMEMDR